MLLPVLLFSTWEKTLQRIKARTRTRPHDFDFSCTLNLRGRNENMFPAKTKALVRNLGAQGDLIHNENINEKMELLTLVKVREKKLWPVIKYTIIDQTLLDLLEEPDCSPEFTEKVLMMDFKSLRRRCGDAAVAVEAPAAVPNLGSVKVRANVDEVDEASPVTLNKKTVDIDKLRKSCSDKWMLGGSESWSHTDRVSQKCLVGLQVRKIKKKVLDLLKVKETEKLTFVYQTVSNTAPVTFCEKVKEEGCFSAAFKIFSALTVTGKKDVETTFTVPEDSTFAYGLMEIQTEDGTLGIPPRTRKMAQFNAGWWNLSSDGEDSQETLQQVKTEIKMKEALLKPLADLPESTRQDLLKTLRQLLDDRKALTLLVDQVSTKACDCPQSQAVSSFMDLLKASNASSPQEDAVHTLVNAMDTLPDGVPALLTTCSPETLRVLNQLVSGLKEDGQVKLPESLPRPLQEDGELRWAAELLCSTDDTLRELSEQWEPPGFPAVLLEVLSLVVTGLSLMSL